MKSLFKFKTNKREMHYGAEKSKMPKTGFKAEGVDYYKNFSA